ncbi:MAG: hypothetical protein CMK38_00105 [Porticoccaceae bacterium]|nr:hypothetical protein [Porticoccaceae bacterium]|tara:strand:- start:250 stop:1296 length:1047 start_codon:yes stop_codon:yes gene_type:complete
MRDKVEFTDYFKDFILYAAKAKKVQNECNLGGAPYVGSCGDDLIENVTIYDTVERKHAGFQNMLQDLWFADSAPKYYKWTKEHQARNESFKHLQDTWSRREWLFIFLAHRITGSGASFEVDHGYRNTILPELAKLKTAEEMVEWIKRYEGVMYTSVGNQIPAFPKPRDGYKTGGKVYFGEYALNLVDDVWKFVDEINKDRKALIREIVDFMCTWNRERGMKAFHFQYTATVADLADYYVDLVDEASHMYYGKNAQEAMDLFATKKARINKAQFYDVVMEEAKIKTGGFPKDLEDVMCDYIRFVENYIPDNREKTYASLDRTKIWNTSIITNHPKGRQKWMLGTQNWKW